MFSRIRITPMTLEWPLPWMSLAEASTWPETEIKTRRKPWLEKTRQNPMGNLRWRINVPKLRVDSWMNHMDTLISFSTWIFIDFNGFSQIFSPLTKVPTKTGPALPIIFFSSKKKKSDFQLLFCFFTFRFFYIKWYQSFTIATQKTNYIPFLYDLPNQYKKLLFLLFVKPNSFFFLKKISPCAQLLQ